MKSWVVAHSPLCRKDIVGHEHELGLLEDYLKGKTTRPILLGGPTGGGKTTMVVALATEMDFEVVEVNASDTRNKGAIEQVVGNALKQQSLFMRQRLVLVDEVDSVSGRSDRGAIPSLVRLIKETKTHMIFTANDAMSDKLKALRKVCMVVQLNPLEHEHVVKHLSRVSKKEKTSLSAETLSAIGRRSGGDLRAAVNDLQTVAITGEDNLDILGARDVTADIADALLRVFKT
ncbi:AAA family ATPase, partial [Candidatus Woesearchaeota archaeon]|nr:AAA family ATPase [Candidatus Woesearchaeota archaeon]